LASDAIFMKMPDNTVALYSFDIDFAQEKDYETTFSFVTNTWTQIILKNYSYSETASCWIKDWTYFNVPNNTFDIEGMYVFNAENRKNKW